MCGRGEYVAAFSNNGLDAYCLDISSDAAFVYQDKTFHLFHITMKKVTYSIKIYM